MTTCPACKSNCHEYCEDRNFCNCIECPQIESDRELILEIKNGRY